MVSLERAKAIVEHWGEPSCRRRAEDSRSDKIGTDALDSVLSS